MFNFKAYQHLPSIDGLERYLIDGIPTGSFLYSVLTNDLREACNRADIFNRGMLFQYIQFLYNEAPAESWGTPERVKAWEAQRGMNKQKITREMV